MTNPLHRGPDASDKASTSQSERSAAPGSNLPPAGNDGLGISKPGPIASTLANARAEIEDDMPKPTRLAGPSHMGQVGRGGMLRAAGPTSGSSMMHGQQTAGLLEASHVNRSRQPLGISPRYGLADKDEPADGLSIPVLGDASFAVGHGRHQQPTPAISLKPPAFDDDIDDETMAAEEAAFLAQMRGKKQYDSGIAAAKPTEGLGECGSNISEAQGLSTSSRRDDRQEPVRQPAPPSPEDDLDDLSEEEL